MNTGKIFSFSGAQSTGKSTLLDLIEKQFGDRLIYFPEITRQLRSKGFTINEDGDDKTQRAIINQHEDNMDVANVITAGTNYLTPKSVVMDRCIWDGVIYTNWLYHEDEEKVSKETLDYAYETFDLLIGGYDCIFYTDPTDVKLVDDGERSSSKTFRDQIIEMFENSIIEVSRHTEVVRLKGSIDKRMKTIIEYLK
jgi:nicotinamide riboside kinase